MEHFPFSLFFYLKLIWDTRTLQCAIVTVRNEVAKVMFLQACVCPHGGCLPQCMLGYHTPPSGADPPEQTPPSPWEQTPPTPGADTHPPWSRQPPLGADNPPRETATAADGTHPTGMHSCWKYVWSHDIIPQYSVHSQGVPNVNF